jgi:hypothetical protein
MNPLVPKPLTSGGRADGRFDKRDFVYNAKRNEYRCPAGQRTIWRFSTVENGLTIHKYWSSAGFPVWGPADFLSSEPPEGVTGGAVGDDC